MRVNFAGQLGTGSNEIASRVVTTVTSPLILHNNPTSPLEASTKQYADNATTNLNASNIKEGTISATRFPAFTGDVTSATGTGTFTLSNSGVTPGTYTKVTVNTKGRVIGGGQITNDDIPVFSWNKIIGQKPTTLAGYGITDGVSISGGTLAGIVSLNNEPTNALHAVNKQYVDFIANASTYLKAGDIIRRSASTTPSGYLRCNGGEAIKANYEALYSVLDAPDTNVNVVNIDYTDYGAIGSGQPWRQQYDLNSFKGDLVWSSTYSLPVKVSNSNIIVTKNRLYLLGGFVNSKPSDVIYSASVAASGELSGWYAMGKLPVALSDHSVVVTLNRVYVIGGSTSDGTRSSAIYSASINADGTLGTWTTGNALPVTLYGSNVLVTKNRIYVMGGNQNSAISSAVYTAPISATGEIGAWVAGTAIPTTLSYGQVVTTKNRVYLIGGISGSTFVSTVYTAVINSDGTLGAWSAGTNLPAAVGYASSFVTKNRVYLLGGTDAGVNGSNKVYTAPINPDGTLGTWTLNANNLPSTLALSHTVVVRDNLYMIGGMVSDSVGYTSSVYRAKILNGIGDYTRIYDGSINKFDGSNVSGTIVLNNDVYMPKAIPGGGKPWVQQGDINFAQSSDIGSWTSAGTLPIALKDSQVLVTKSRVYTVGGNVGASANNIDTVYSSVVNSDGTLGAWVDTRVTSDVVLTGDNTGKIPYGVTTVTLTAKGGDGGSDTNVVLNGTGSGTIPVGPSSVIITGKGGDGITEMYPGGKPWKLQYDVNTQQSGDITGWTTGTSLPEALGGSQAVVTKNRVYLLGGYNGSSGWVSTVYTAAINSDGTLGSWSTGTSLPRALAFSQAVVTKNRVYLLGGVNASSYTSAVYTASINSDGTLGSWTTGTALPAALGSSQAVVTKNRVYLLGGRFDGGGYTSAVYTAAINPDGTLGGWTEGTPLPGALGWSQAVVTKNRVYLLGGYNGSSGWVSTVYTAAINSDGTLGSWTTGTSLPGVLSHSQAVVTKNRVYLLGGRDGGSVSTVYTAPIIGGLNDYSTYYSGNTTNGQNTTVTINGFTYTFNGGAGGPATQSTQTATIPGTSVSNYSHSVAAGGLGALTYTTYTSTETTLTNTGNGTIPSGVKSITITGKGGDGGYDGLIPGFGKPWSNFYGIATANFLNQSLNILNVTEPFFRYSQVVVTNSRVYVIGGSPWNDSSTIYYDVNSEGILGTYKLGTYLPRPSSFGSVAVTKNRVYLIGGQTINSQYAEAYVYTAPIDGTGIIGEWSEAVQLPTAQARGDAVVIKDKLYYFSRVGESENGIVPRAYYASINTDGTLNNWLEYNDYSYNIPSKVFATKGYLYGWTQSNLPLMEAKINADGTLGSWSHRNDIPTIDGDIYNNFLIATTDKVYISGQTLRSLPLDTNGRIPLNSAVTTEINTPVTGQVFAVKNRLYFIGPSNGLNTKFSYLNFSGGKNSYAEYYNGSNLGNPITGTATTVTINGTTYTFNGGTGVPATQTTKTATLPGTSSVSYSYSIAPTGSGKLNYLAPTVTNGTNTVVTINGTQHTFNGGISGPATPSTKTITLTGTTDVNISYSVPFNGSAKLNYADATTSRNSGLTLPKQVSKGQLITTKNKVYYIGGTTDGVNASSSIFTATINTDGTVTNWTYHNTNLPTGVFSSQAIVTKNRVYVIGGNSSITQNKIYTATVGADGNLGSFTEESLNLPASVERASLVLTKTRVYLLGGHATNSLNTIYYSVINSNGTLGAWTSEGTLPAALSSSQVYVTKTKVFLIGGNTTTASNAVYSATISAEGVLGAFSAITALPTSIHSSQVAATQNAVYLLGGSDGNNAVTSIYKTTITGGLNDYMPYYDGTILSTSSNTFRLPDLTSLETTSEYYFIKY